MWVSQQKGRNQAGQAPLELGNVTIAGEMTGAFTDGERRNLALVSPGGYHWRPQVGQQVLVLKAGTDGEVPCAVGALEGEFVEMEPGEIYICASGGASIRLGSDGRISLSGDVVIDGTLTVTGEVEMGRGLDVADYAVIKGETYPSPPPPV